MRRFWDEKKDNILRRNYPKCDLKSIAARFGVSVGAIKCRAGVLGLHRKVNVKEKWTDKQLDYLRKHYADMRAEDIAKKVKHSTERVWYMAKKLGLGKSQEFYQECGRRSAATAGAIACRFRKGQSPLNKGKRQVEFMSPESIERTKATRFKKGHKPHNTQNVGHERITDDGYIMIKVSDDMPMVLKHRHLWEITYGEIPDGFCVAFRDGNRMNCTIENLFLISREDNARRRTSSETPEQRKKRLEKVSATNQRRRRRIRQLLKEYYII